MHNQCGNGQNRNARTHDDDDNASFDPCTVTAHLPVHSLVDAKSLCHILQFNSGIILTTTACGLDPTVCPACGVAHMDPIWASVGVWVLADDLVKLNPALEQATKQFHVVLTAVTDGSDVGSFALHVL